MTTEDPNNLHHRLDQQDAILLEIRDKLLIHIAVEESYMPTLKEMASFWKGSKILGGMLASLAALLAGSWALIVWAKDHLK